jgi:hypothetical protein
MKAVNIAQACPPAVAKALLCEFPALLDGG